MSNNRKRNMRKLARNIITGTALAVGGLAPAGAAEQHEAADGGMSTATKASLGLSTVIGAGTILSGVLQYQGNKNLTTKGQEETARHNKVVEDREKVKKEREDMEYRTGYSQQQCTLIADRLKQLAAKHGGANNASWTDVLEGLASKGLVRDVLVSILGEAGWVEANQFNVTKAYVTKLRESWAAEGIVAGLKEVAEKARNFQDASVDSIIVVGSHAGAERHAKGFDLTDETGDLDNGLDLYGPAIAAGANAANPVISGDGAGAKNTTKLMKEIGNAIIPGEKAKKLFKDCFPVGLATMLPDRSGAGGWVGTTTAVTKNVLMGRIGGTTKAERQARLIDNRPLQNGLVPVDLVFGTKIVKNAYAANDAIALRLFKEAKYDGQQVSDIQKNVGRIIVGSLQGKISDEDKDKEAEGWGL